ncbi:MAG: GNAT family N-acetyltransferase [Candidatus Thorarchaeota archaeon]|nr:GNAT family N-acetyltransferase [Candidatus Thorarchaeota archaeon]
MLQEFKIRPFEREDIEAVVDINRSCLPENYPDQFFLGLYHHAPKAFLVVECDEGICGYIMCRIERGISSFGRAPVKKGHIVSVAVRTRDRHQGIGSRLVIAAMKGMREYGASEFFLEVRKTNEEAVLLYEKLNYEIKRVLKGYYRDGEDAYLMVLDAGDSMEEDSPDE